ATQIQTKPHQHRPTWYVKAPMVQTRQTWLVAFVHGVGAPSPDEMRNAAIRAINDTKPGYIKISSEIDTDLADGSRATIQKGTFGTSKAFIGEVFWGNIARARRQGPHLILAVILACFRLPHVIKAALGAPHPFSNTIAQLIRVMALVLRI